MDRLCRVISTHKKYKIREAVVNGDASKYEGVKTIEANNGCNFSNISDFCIWIVTWNMNGQVSYEDIRKLVGTERKYDLLIIGLQEVPRRNILELLENALVQSHVLLEKAIMQSLQLYMFCSKNARLFIRGFGGCGGFVRRKKGAVAIRITYKEMHMVFISCHLSAHAHNTEERNSQCRHISHSLFSKSCKPAQVIVWLGDLNYRLQGIHTLPARYLIHKNMYGLLSSKDQLLQEAERGQVFNGYCEGTLAFKPTYKYDIGTCDYDTSYKVRVPAWTDRILYKVEDKDINATLQFYESIDNIYSSDHKPVKAHISFKFKVDKLYT